MTTELEALEGVMVEQIENVSDLYVEARLDTLFQSNATRVSTIGSDEFIDGKRRVRSKPKCNLAISTTRPNNFFVASANGVPGRNAWLEACRDPQCWPMGRRFRERVANPSVLGVDGDGVSLRKVRRFYYATGDKEKVLIWHDAAESELAAPRDYRAIGACYAAERPENEYPEHTHWPDNSRNSSPTRKKDAGQLNAFWDYHEMNKSVEPLQSNYMQTDNDNYSDPDREEGDALKPIRGLEAEWEMRPGNELVERCDAPTVQYETRQAGLITGPRLSDCGYCMAPTSPFVRAMKIPVGGDVDCMVTRTTSVRIKTRLVERKRDELVKISDLKRDDKWSLYRIDDLRFAQLRTNKHFRGQLTHYRDNGRWFPAKDQYGTPYGPKSRGSSDKFWKPVHPLTGKSGVVDLSPAGKAKQMANKVKPLPCPMMTDDMLKAFLLKLETNGRPANDNRAAQYDGLPYDVKSADELRFGYAFGKTYASPTYTGSSDDVSERKQLLAEVNARLSPSARLVANMVVSTDETDTLAQNYAEVGAALATGRKTASERTLIRHGQKAVSDAANEIGALLQELAA